MGIDIPHHVNKHQTFPHDNVIAMIASLKHNKKENKYKYNAFHKFLSTERSMRIVFLKCIIYLGSFYTHRME